MIGTAAFRRKQGEYQIDRLAVNGIKIQRRCQLSKNSLNFIQIGKTSVRKSRAAAKTRRTQIFTFQQRIKNGAFVKTGEFSRLSGNFLQKFTFTVSFNAD